jgi:hypothetical protein
MLASVIMSPENYKEALESLKRDLHEAKVQHRASLDLAESAEQRIAHLRQSISALSQLCGEKFEEDDEFGLTDLVRMALKTHGGPLTAVDVKTRLEQLGYPQKSENALPSIHTVLKRLVLKGEANDTAIKEGKTAYRWSTVPPPPSFPKDVDMIEDTLAATFKKKKK